MKFSLCALVIAIAVVQSQLVSTTPNNTMVGGGSNIGSSNNNIGSSNSNVGSNEEVMRWTQEIVSAFNAQPMRHFDILLHVNEDTKILVTDLDSPVGGEFKGMIGYWSFVERLHHGFNLTDANFTIVTVDPTYFRALISANFKLTSLFSQQQKSTNLKGKILIDFDVSGKIIKMLIVDENQQQTCLDLSPRGVFLLNEMQWAYFKSQPLTMQSQVWNLIDDNVQLKFKNLPTQLMNESTIRGKQAMISKMQLFQHLVSPQGMTPDIRSLEDLIFHKKFHVVTLFSDDNSVLSEVIFGKLKYFTLHTFAGDKLVSCSVTFSELLKPWNILSPPSLAMNQNQQQMQQPQGTGGNASSMCNNCNGGYGGY